MNDISSSACRANSLDGYGFSWNYWLEDVLERRESAQLDDRFDSPKSISVEQTNSLRRRKFLRRLRFPAMPALFIFFSSCFCFISCSWIPSRDYEVFWEAAHALSISFSSLKTLLFRTSIMLSLTLSSSLRIDSLIACRCPAPLSLGED